MNLYRHLFAKINIFLLTKEIMGKTNVAFEKSMYYGSNNFISLVIIFTQFRNHSFIE